MPTVRSGGMWGDRHQGALTLPSKVHICLKGRTLNSESDSHKIVSVLENIMITDAL